MEILTSVSHKADIKASARNVAYLLVLGMTMSKFTPVGRTRFCATAFSSWLSVGDFLSSPSSHKHLLSDPMSKKGHLARLTAQQLLQLEGLQWERLSCTEYCLHFQSLNYSSATYEIKIYFVFI